MKYCLILAALCLLAAIGCTRQPDPYCPGGEVIVTDCALCRGAMSLFDIPAVSPADYKAATQKASTMPTSQPNGD